MEGLDFIIKVQTEFQSTNKKHKQDALSYYFQWTNWFLMQGSSVSPLMLINFCFGQTWISFESVWKQLFGDKQGISFDWAKGRGDIIMIGEG